MGRIGTVLLLAAFLAAGCASQPKAFVALSEVDPSIAQEIRYASSHNFVGHPVKGYDASRCLLTRPAAQALQSVQTELRAQSLTLRVYDCYRPQSAVNEFVRWAKDQNDLKMKNEFYPNVDKANLFRDGYIAEKSGHSRGSTVDLTIESLDMGTAFDYFDPLAHTDNPSASAVQKRNRRLLKTVMERHGFKNLPEEWWHYTWVNEPFPSTYFDFEIK